MAAVEDYRSRLADRRERAAAHEKTHLTLGNVRLLIGIAAGIMAWFSFVRNEISPLWLIVPAAAFTVLAIVHERVVRRQSVAKRAVQFYDRGVARIEDRWAGSGESGERFADASHPYAEDLDLFGRGSLFELLNEARTKGGEDTLASWLRAPASVAAIRARQQAIEELRSETDLREEVFVLGEGVRGAVDSARLTAWAEAPPVLRSMRLWMAVAALSVAVLIAAIVAVRTGVSSPLALALLAVAGFGFWLRPRVLAVITHVDEAVHDLELLSDLLLRIETRTFQCGALLALRQSLNAEGRPPSEHIRHLHRLAEWIDSRDNAFVRAAGPPLLYGTHLAFAVERWRAHCGGSVRQWLDTLGEFEALLSLAGYAFEHSGDPFPVFRDELRIEGEDLGHPLIPDSKCVRNSIRLEEPLRLLVVSGSNMSGKSTYLRAIGINVVLAMAGAPVRARSMTLCALSAGASIRITDSLQGGASRFYAEITRLRKIVELADRGPVVFLLDELLAGTNSHDRKIGAEGILKGLLARKALGLITTHDLALTTIAESFGAAAANVHFEDTLEDGKLRFDHRIRPGVVRKSNALELMRSVGLDV